MNYYQPRELKDEDGKSRGLYHYTCMNDGRIWPVGPCAEDCGGHPNPEEAREHYTAWALAEVSEEDYGDWTGCRAVLTDQEGEQTVCGDPTKKGLHGQGLFRDTGIPFCGDHIDADRYREMVGTIGDVTASW